MQLIRFFITAIISLLLSQQAVAQTNSQWRERVCSADPFDDSVACSASSPIASFQGDYGFEKTWMVYSCTTKRTTDFAYIAFEDQKIFRVSKNYNQHSLKMRFDQTGFERVEAHESETGRSLFFVSALKLQSSLFKNNSVLVRLPFYGGSSDVTFSLKGSAKAISSIRQKCEKARSGNE